MSTSPLTKLMAGLKPGKKGAEAALWQPGPYPRLAEVNFKELMNREGIYALWHLGVRPQWLRVGASVTLGTALAELAQAPWLAMYEQNRGVFAAWMFPPAKDCPGMVRYLVARLQPALQAAICAADLPLDVNAKPIVCPLPPGTQEP